jgi:thioredoxin reductase (NADPH)
MAESLHVLLSEMSELYDVIILGGGPAGLTAGIYTARHNLRTLLLEEDKLGGRASGEHWLDNFPGFPEGISGADLMGRFIAQAERFGVEFRMESVLELSVMDDLKMITTRSGMYQGRTVVVATGIQRKKLRVPGELEFKGRGVSYCSICDGPLYAGKIVAVVGPGEEAVDEALRMAEIASKVYAIPGVKGYGEEGERLLEHEERIEVVGEAEVESINGDIFVTHIELKGSQSRTLEVDGVFIILDKVPTTAIIREAGILTNESGCILVDKDQQTNIEGVFAAGDCVCGGMQVVTAAGEGGKAGLAVLRYVKQKG